MPRNADSRSSSTTWRRLNPPEAESHRPTVARSCAVESRLSAAGTFGMDSVETRSVPQIGWIAVPRYGSAVVGQITVRLGASDGALERRAQLDRATAELRVAELAANAGVAAAKAAGTAAAEFRAALDAARAHEAAATGERRRAEEAERLAARRLEAIVREAAWHAAQLERLTGEVARARAAVPSVVTPAPPPTNLGERDALATWQARATELRVRRDRVGAQSAELDGARRDAERRRAAAEAAIGLDEQRIAAADHAQIALADRDRALEAERDALAGRLAETGVREAETGSTIAALLAADAEDRARLGTAERASAAARDRLRRAEDGARSAEHRDLEARLGLEALREQLLVELAGLGSLSLHHLPAPAADGTTCNPRPQAVQVQDVAGGDDSAGPDDDRSDPDSDDMAPLAAALAAAAEIWEATPPSGGAPSPGRLANLRRRYHELGAANPFAVDEYATVHGRLQELEGQHGDLRAAIDRTRALIAELDTMISEQFRSTFAALETRFDARFQQLFGGGFARLLLTDPNDLASTGIEIVARPPGKKAQALAMLSGGERALTAVALLFAMLEVRPVPFCVLDEVDAALDEANVSRFTAALRELAQTTQFIVITHNRGTIEIADALYGVTVGDDSVSRVISLRLDEATELAELGRDTVAVGPGTESA